MQQQSNRNITRFFDWYLHASLHVALATTALVQMTFYFCFLPFNTAITSLVFFGTVFSYNFIKYAQVIAKKKELTLFLKSILALSVISFVIAVISFFFLNLKAQLLTVFFGLLCVLYVIPLAKSKTNLRNYAGIKIYIVSLCWAGVTTLLPIVNADQSIENDILFKFLQRFILTLILILIFEINDLKYDDIRLKTVPQTIGVLKTKYLIGLLLIPFYFLEFLKVNYYGNQWIINLILVCVIALFTYYANPNRSKYYTLFWVESIPVLWYLLIILFNFL
ncbi:UbiA prenyltransferase family protein [Paenimyroides baculatum]|uniref:Prenyltransferase n=1 Tax=Paenimyroides baculatum TaxID=2608000 RepID=A0A5M6CD51_9FLAO|nr:hypothetical protein [Paenimyroides baculatum]KAA5533094.1 hypothetical protein F0460_12395 [Paenimyroides baculatum]